MLVTAMCEPHGVLGCNECGMPVVREHVDFVTYRNDTGGWNWLCRYCVTDDGRGWRWGRVAARQDARTHVRTCQRSEPGR
jgi:hypothetical protein